MSDSSVAEHYDRLDPFYRDLWGDHLHHGLWSDVSSSPREAVRGLVHRVALDAGIGEGTRVCDVGCGYGAPARLWADVYGASVVGYTVSEAQHRYAVRQSVEGPPPDYRLQDFLANDLPSGTVEAVTAIESLTHIRDPTAALREVRRILRPEGVFVACVWMAGPAPPGWARRHLLDPIRTEGRLTGLPTATTLSRWTSRAGLTIERLDDVTGQVRRTWTLVLRRVAWAIANDPALRRLLLDPTESERVFARTLPRIWVAQHLGALRYGWLVARRG